ncbi:MAG: glycosyltransferase family 4 protein [Burkholderiales bacterium]
MRPQAGPLAITDRSLNVLIVCDHASARFGGEAILPLHYFRLLRDRGFEVWLVAHARTRGEISELFPDEKRIRYVDDTLLHKLLWRIGAWLPSQIAYVTTGFASRFAVQMALRKVVRSLVASEGIDIVHQPTPVSPREPSIIFDVGAPVVIGPMNGGMNYPPAFRRERGWVESLLLRFGRTSAAWLNALMPGKQRAALLLVANARTRHALPAGLCAQVEQLVENGVDLNLWHARADVQRTADAGVTRFAFVGRLLSLKAVDVLLEAFAIASAQAPMRLLIIGDGEERERLLKQAQALFPRTSVDADDAPVRFTGWLPQTVCARELAEVDCLVMPSLHDCGGAVVLEAMSMSKPVIATAWGGPLDYLDDSCGILIEPHDRATLVKGFAQAMVRIANSPLERVTMGRAARLKIEDHYDWDVKAGRILHLYRQVLGARAMPAATASV